MLMYTAEMKLPRYLQKADKRKRVDSVISQLRLEKCRNTVIGNVLRRGIADWQVL
ncbi:Abcg8 [Symbiodinium sp. CCMP2456]|nr:Abcg8 [Symbiodinium sp. CCMP2456]